MARLTTKIHQSAFDIKHVLLDRLSKEYNTEYQKSVFLAGTGRSGTTWLSNIINYKRNYRYIFEPFHPDQVSLCSNFSSKQYIRPSRQAPQFYQPVKQILSGSLRNEWADRYCQNLSSQKRLVKSVRANLFLRWLHTQFPNLPIILIIRNPLAVANSRAKLKWGTSLDKYLRQDDLVEDHLAPFQDEIDKAQIRYAKTKDIFESSIFTWCIEHYVPLRQFRQGEIHIVFYEEILKNFETEIRNLMRFIKQDYDDEVLREFNKPSQMSREDSAIKIGKNSVDGWKNDDVDQRRAQQAEEILTLFGLNGIYSDDLLPDKKRLEEIMKTL